MTDRYENIRQALAMGPTPGPWEPVTDRPYSDLPYLVLGAGASDAKSAEWVPLYVHVGGRSGWMEQKANTLLIAACDPDTIRALLEERDALQAEVEALRAEVAVLNAQTADLEEENADLEAQIAELKADTRSEIQNLEASRDGYRDDARALHDALTRMVAMYESEFDHEDTYLWRPDWLREALARTSALQEGGE